MDLRSSGHFTNMSVNTGTEPVTKMTQISQKLSTFVAEKRSTFIRK